MLLLTATLFVGSNVCVAKIIKWVDSNGVTHYGDKPPTPSSTKKTTEVNQYGVPIKTHEHTIKKKNTPAEQSKDDIAKQRYDNALKASFSSVEDIELARKRNVEMDELALESLEQRYRALKEKAAKNKHSNSSEMALLQNVELQIESKKAAIAAINQRYEKDKIRYLELTTKQR